jgi:hypothetical protein
MRNDGDEEKAAATAVVAYLLREGYAPIRIFASVLIFLCILLIGVAE